MINIATLEAAGGTVTTIGELNFYRNEGAFIQLDDINHHIRTPGFTVHGVKVRLGNQTSLHADLVAGRVNWAKQDAELARQYNVTRDRIRQLRYTKHAQKSPDFKFHRMGRLVKSREDELVAAIPTMGVKEFIARFGISYSAASMLAKRHNLKFIRCGLKYLGLDWSLPDADLATQLGTSVNNIRRARRLYGKPKGYDLRSQKARAAHGLPPIRRVNRQRTVYGAVNWDLPDSIIAKQLGKLGSSVALARATYGHPAKWNLRKNADRAAFIAANPTIKL